VGGRVVSRSRSAMQPGGGEERRFPRINFKVGGGGRRASRS
jgi:hypothetical protein